MGFKFEALVILCVAIATSQALKKPERSISEADLISRLQLTKPPKITEESENEIAYKKDDEIILKCVAEGNPTPAFGWLKDREPLTIDGLKIVRTLTGGTIKIKNADSSDDGVYQCNATNEFGRAFSAGTKVSQTYIEAFTDVEVRERDVTEGSYLKLTCNPPRSYPTAVVYWALSKAEDEAKISALDYDKRVSQDYDGNLHFANAMLNETLKYKCIVPHGGSLTTGPINDVRVKPYPGNLHFANTLLEDGNEDFRYVCVSFNYIMRSIVQGDDKVLKIKPAPGGVRAREPTLKWSSDPEPIAIAGSLEFKMKCIFDGYPSPDIEWLFEGGALPSRIAADATGTELIIKNVEPSDEGKYTCQGLNSRGRTPANEIKLTVHSRPRWVIKPDDINSSEEEGAEFECTAESIPPPSITWYSNGEKFSDLEVDDRITFSENKVIFKDLTKTDARVLQCNASNEYGYIFANAYLNVLAEPPTFVLKPQAIVKAAEGQSIVVTCQVFGAPTPEITWRFEGEDMDMSNNRFTLQKKGNMTIDNVLMEDEGYYTCFAENKFGDEEATGKLEVRVRTSISTPPESQTVMVTDDVTFHCEASTDENEEKKLKYIWLKNGEEIDFEKEPRISKNMKDHSITITKCTVFDTAEYTCRADNGLDSDEFTATLTVQGPPDPPISVSVDSCRSQAATITLIPGHENNNEVIEYIIYHNTTFDPPNTYIEDKRLPKDKLSDTIRLSPWANYTFSAVARNSIGVSERSFATTTCRTPPSTPYTNPENVCSVSRNPDELVITWDPMEKIDHNGGDFYYIVSYRRLDISDGKEITEKIKNAKKSELTIGGQETFKKYEIYVQAGNEKGPSPASKLERKYAFSGEDIPSESPQGFKLDEDSLNATYGVFSWDPVDESPEKVNGHFRGYKIKYWKTDDPENPKYEDIILRSYDPCPLVEDNSRRRRQSGGAVDGHVNDLWPFSQITAGVFVVNGGKSGELSDTIDFSTPQGPPGVIGTLDVTEQGSHHLKVVWTPPVAPNGIITSYVVAHQEEGTGPIKEKVIVDPLKRHTRIKDLKPDTKYRVYIWGLTEAGDGDRYYVDSNTKPSTPPDVPVIADIESGDDFLNVSWTPSEEGKEDNPGQRYYIEYRKEGEGDDAWVKKYPDEDEDWANITGLAYGEMYEIRVVAVNGDNEESRSDMKSVRVGPGEEKVVQSIATAGWFIGLMCAILFLLLILIIICLIKRNRGGKYPVHEKERLRGRDPDKEDEEGGFGEYTKHGGKITSNPLQDLHVFDSRKSDDPDYKKSKGSLNSEEKPLEESDSDSMAEYDQMDPSKFNEDGSFIGQYGSKPTKKEENSTDVTSPSALSTFV